MKLLAASSLAVALLVGCAGDDNSNDNAQRTVDGFHPIQLPDSTWDDAEGVVRTEFDGDVTVEFSLFYMANDKVSLVENEGMERVVHVVKEYNTKADWAEFKTELSDALSEHKVRIKAGTFYYTGIQVAASSTPEYFITNTHPLLSRVNPEFSMEDSMTEATPENMIEDGKGERMLALKAKLYRMRLPQGELVDSIDGIDVDADGLVNIELPEGNRVYYNWTAGDEAGLIEFGSVLVDASGDDIPLNGACTGALKAKVQEKLSTKEMQEQLNMYPTVQMTGFKALSMGSLQEYGLAFGAEFSLLLKTAIDAEAGVEVKIVVSESAAKSCN